MAVNNENSFTALKKESEIFNHIADLLASSYNMIYYVRITDEKYAEFIPDALSGKLKLHSEGSDFFGFLQKEYLPVIHANDRERVARALSRDAVIEGLRYTKKYITSYRVSNDGVTGYMRAIVMRSADGEYILVCFENIDVEIRKEKDRIKAFNQEKELARRDGLTGIKNKTAYIELVNSVQQNIDSGLDYLTFAIIVCDINGLKEVNDNDGHQAGDEYLCACSDLICGIFKHSPVFRIGGDEFVVFIRGGDYAFKDTLFEKLRKQVLVNIRTPGKPVVASGISTFDPLNDKKVSDVFERADAMMYDNKRELKGGEPR